MRDIETMREPVIVEKKLWERYRCQRLAPFDRTWASHDLKAT
jgi:hypothetical protein